jgi:hypothetical protein
MNGRKILPSVLILLTVLLWTLPVQAFPSFFSQRCASCHSDDTPTCNGCHNHRGTLQAWTDQPEYEPGQLVTVTLDGGTQSGWIRAILYDENGIELVRATGPTGTGDDGQGNPVEFPVDLQAPAPADPGDYTWEAAWFGNQNDASGHFEVRVPVTVHVTPPSAAPDPGTRDRPDTWGRIKRFYR